MGRNLKDYWELEGDIRKFKTLEAAKEVCYEDFERFGCSDLEGREVWHFKDDKLIKVLKVHLINENNDLEFIDGISEWYPNL